jgi:hypothetical protein
MRQGCSTSPTLFNIYLDDIFRTWKSKIHQGFYLGRNSFFNYLLCANDAIIIQNSENELQRTIFELNKTADNYDLKISVTKTKTMVFKGNILGGQT